MKTLYSNLTKLNCTFSERAILNKSKRAKKQMQTRIKRIKSAGISWKELKRSTWLAFQQTYGLGNSVLCQGCGTKSISRFKDADFKPLAENWFFGRARKTEAWNILILCNSCFTLCQGRSFYTKEHFIRWMTEELELVTKFDQLTKKGLIR